MSKSKTRQHDRRRVRHAVAVSDITHLGKGKGIKVGYDTGPRPGAYGKVQPDGED